MEAKEKYKYIINFWHCSGGVYGFAYILEASGKKKLDQHCKIKGKKSGYKKWESISCYCKNKANMSTIFARDLVFLLKDKHSYIETKRYNLSLNYLQGSH